MIPNKINQKHVSTVTKIFRVIIARFVYFTMIRGKKKEFFIVINVVFVELVVIKITFIVMFVQFAYQIV